MATLLHRLNQWRHRRPGHLLPFRIPFFRIFYSTTYTTLFFLTLVMLAITPATLLYTAISANAFQYVFMIGGVYVLTAILALFVYSSRLYTNRSVLADVGKAYIPVENGEVLNKVRKMIVEQLERSDIVAWESRPRDVLGEVMRAEKNGLLAEDEAGRTFNRDEWTVGTVISIDPAKPPWGEVQHPGWTAPAMARGEVLGNLQFESVITEMANLIEARAVSLAPSEQTVEDDVFGIGEQPGPDPAIVDVLRRQPTMGLGEYLSQLSYLGLINPPAIGQDFLSRYEVARFSGKPSSETDFNDLMAYFSQLLEGMTELSPDIIAEIRAQTGAEIESDTTSLVPSEATGSVLHFATPEPPRSQSSSPVSPVTARTRMSRNATPYLQQMDMESEESLGSVLRRSPDEDGPGTPKAMPVASNGLQHGVLTRRSGSLDTVPSDAGSVLHHDLNSSNG